MKISKIMVVILSIIILSFMLFSSGCSCYENDTPVKIETVVTQKAESAAIYPKHKMGEPVPFNEVILTVNKARIGKPDVITRTATGYHYMVVSITVENPTETEISDFSDSHHSFLEDDQNYQFKYICVNNITDGYLTIPAGGKITIDVCYEIPKDKKGLTLVYHGYDANPKEVHFSIN